MRNYLIITLIFISLNVKGQDDYVIEINGKKQNISLDKKYELSINGKIIDFIVSVKDTFTYVDDFYSFQHLKDYMVSKMQIDEGIEQIMLMTAEGSGVLIQKYSTINPTMLNEMMLKEVTKESLNYGFKLNRIDYQRTLRSGQSIVVNKAILTYNNETNIYEIASIGQKDAGIIIMTIIMDENRSNQGRKIIDLMWNSLIYK